MSAAASPGLWHASNVRHAGWPTPDSFGFGPYRNLGIDGAVGRYGSRAGSSAGSVPPQTIRRASSPAPCRVSRTRRQDDRVSGRLSAHPCLEPRAKIHAARADRNPTRSVAGTQAEPDSGPSCRTLTLGPVKRYRPSPAGWARLSFRSSPSVRHTPMLGVASSGRSVGGGRCRGVLRHRRWPRRVRYRELPRKLA